MALIASSIPNAGAIADSKVITVSNPMPATMNIRVPKRSMAEPMTRDDAAANKAGAVISRPAVGIPT